LAAYAEKMLRILLEYIEQNRRCIQPGETVAWPPWLVRFVKDDSNDNVLVGWELDPRNASDYIPGCTTAIAVWKAEAEACFAHKSKMEPPDISSLIFVSPQALQHDVVIEGVRFKPEGNGCGWWLIDDNYDGSSDQFASMKPLHVGHVLVNRPDVGRYLALQPGYHFRTDAENAVWFDAEHAEQ
jgi:hypothetical protein